MKDRTEEIKALREFLKKYSTGPSGWLEKTVAKLKRGDTMFGYLCDNRKDLLRLLYKHGDVQVAREQNLSLEWIQVSGAPYLSRVYRIAPDYQLPDLTEEVKPRFEKGTPVVFKPSDHVYFVTDRTVNKPDDAPDDWCMFAREDGDLRCYTSDWDEHQELPPQPTLQDGWELTGKAVCCDGTQMLAAGEAWVGLGGRQFVEGAYPSALDFNQWRWVARRVEVKKEPVEAFGSEIEMVAQIEGAPFAYVYTKEPNNRVEIPAGSKINIHNHTDERIVLVRQPKK